MYTGEDPPRVYPQGRSSYFFSLRSLRDLRPPRFRDQIDIAPTMWMLMKDCWNDDPSLRPSAERLEELLSNLQRSENGMHRHIFYMIREISDYIDDIFNFKLLIQVSVNTLFDSTSRLARFAMRIGYLPVVLSIQTPLLMFPVSFVWLQHSTKQGWRGAEQNPEKCV